MAKDKEEYVVRLLLKVDADDPKDAVKQFIEQTQQFGLYSWTYGVMKLETGELWHVDRDSAKRTTLEEAKAAAR